MNAHDLRARPRRRVYEGPRLELVARGARLQAEAIDVTCEGLGVMLLQTPVVPAVGEEIGLGSQRAQVRHVAPARLGLKLLPGTSSAGRFHCPAFAVPPSPWFHRERMRLRVLEAGADGMTVAPDAPLVSGME